MAVTTTKTNKPINPRGNDQSPLAFNRAKLYSGKALSFDGVNDVVTISDNAAVDFGTSDFSIAFIMQSDTAGYGRLIDKRSGTSGYTLSVGISKELVLELNDGTGSTGWLTSSVYADGKLKHVVVSADRDGNASFYVNGVLDEIIDISSKAGNLDSTSDLFIGTDAPSGGGLYYNGLIAGVKMYSTALTAAQVSDLYNNPEKIVPTGVSNDALKLWLPMMEGAGTTAYDGSGNGNHGTISGATYVNGVGSPVAQSAVIDWNKGTNLLTYSEQFNQWTTNVACTITANDTTAPNGTTTADLIKSNNNVTNYVGEFVSHSASTEYVYSCYVKNNDSTLIRLQVYDGAMYHNLEFDGSFTNEASFNLSDYTIESVGDGWYYVSLEYTSNPSATGGFLQVYPDRSGAFKSVFVWGASFEQASTAGPYIPTLSTAQTSPVLLPQGLTTGRDITGVNLFENVRKQGALNLDGNSWAEIHDNASLDFGTGAFTLEAWAKVKFVPQGSSVNCVFGLGGTISSGSSFIFVTNSNAPSFYYGTSGSTAFAKTEGDWVHIVGVYDETNATIYINATQEDQDARTATTMTNDLVKMIGRDSTTFRYYNDQIAQPRIYNRALTAEEVQRNYNAGKNIYTNS